MTGDMVEVSQFPQLFNNYSVSAVPKAVYIEEVKSEGALPEKNYLEKVMEVEGASMKS